MGAEGTEGKARGGGGLFDNQEGDGGTVGWQECVPKAQNFQHFLVGRKNTQNVKKMLEKCLLA